MRSFKAALVQNFVGVIFIAFLVVYIPFNILTNNFITIEAYRELSERSLNIPRLSSGANDERTNFAEAERTLAYWLQVRAFEGLMMSISGIMVNERGEVIWPNFDHLSEDSITLITFLADQYVLNRQSFNNRDMARVINGDNIYYLMAVNPPAYDSEPISVLLYTDITSTVIFARNINLALIILFLASGIISVFLSFVLSSNVQKVVEKLCKYAEAIGFGRFEKNSDDYKYKEFNDLAQSMNSMSNMLAAYDSSQKQFFQNVSHELRTPLMSIQGYAEAILKDVIEKNEASEIILSESERMGALVNQILYISRMDSNLDTLNTGTVNIYDTLNECVWRVKILAEKNEKKINFDFSGPEVKIHTDEEKLQRAIDNILLNCIRHANTIIEVGCEVKNGKAIITISDDGEGIAACDLPHIFDRFYKGPDGNFGLGLAISKDIIEKLGGTIIAENKTNPFTGARFCITIYHATSN